MLTFELRLAVTPCVSPKHVLGELCCQIVAGSVVAPGFPWTVPEALPLSPGLHRDCLLQQERQLCNPSPKESEAGGSQVPG
jgi:hypothetical protein